MTKFDDCALSNYVLNKNPDVSYKGNQNGIDCYSNQSGTLTIAATNEHDYSLMVLDGDTYQQIYCKNTTKSIYDYSPNPMVYGIYNEDTFSSVNYYIDSDRNGVIESEYQRNYDDSIEHYVRDNETGEIEFYSRKKNKKGIEYTLNEDGSKTVIFTGESGPFDPKKWSREYLLDANNNIKGIKSTTQTSLFPNKDPNGNYWSKPEVEYLLNVDYSMSALEEAGYESFENWISREQLTFTTARKLEDPYGDIKNFWKEVTGFFKGFFE